MRILLALLLVVGCGSVTTSELTADGGDAAAGHGGAAGGSNAAGASGSAGSGPSAGANGADAGGRGGSSNGGAGDVGGTGGGMACLPYNTQGFAFNVDESCGDAGRCLPSDPRCCYARCELNGAQFIGCADNAPGGPAARCYASCNDCP